MSRSVFRQSAVRTEAAGFTLIEVVVSLVIVSIAITAVLGVMSKSALSAGESMVRHQAASVANAYLAEALSMPFTDPSGGTGETLRNSLDDVNDYNFVDNGAHNRNGTPIAGLNQYIVTTRARPVTLAPNGVQAIRVDVTVQPPSGGPVVAMGFRTNH